MKIIVLTGAGISAESGIKTFRDSNGLWEKHPIEDVATPEGYHRNPKLVLDFYNQRRKQLLSSDVLPNAAHIALAKLENSHSTLVVTQNVDNLHEKGGSKNVLHIHGELLKMKCTSSGQVFPINYDFTVDTLCECCYIPGNLRPDIVWFGEMPYHLDLVYKELEDCNIFISIGTSGQVYPAASFVSIVSQDCLKVEVNTEPTHGSYFDKYLVGKASYTVPLLVDKLLEAEQPQDILTKLPWDR